jgi:DNA-binding NtrC family response regulator
MQHKIFFLEDNRTQILVLKLAFSGFENVDVSYFSKGKELIEALEVNPDIAIVDLMLPDIDGLELIKTVREKSPTTKIVVISAQEDVNIIAAAQKEGVFNYIVKSESSLSYLRQVITDLVTVIEA